MYPNEVPSLNLPRPSTATRTIPRKPPKNRSTDLNDEPVMTPEAEVEVGVDKEGQAKQDASTQTEMDLADLAMTESKVLNLEEKLNETEKKLREVEKKLQESKFSLNNIKNNDTQVTFFTGFPSFLTLEAFYNFLGPAVDNLKYSKKQEESNLQSRTESKRLRQRIFEPLEEFFMTLVRLHMFGVTVSRITCTWINFLYMKLKELPLWPPKELVERNMPREFKRKYPNTRDVLDATEIYIEQPHLQQMTFSSYKNDNTFKALVGISPDGVITFVSTLFPGSISDKSLTRKSGILDLLEEGDSVMADRGFDLTLVGAHLNMPPFLRGKSQLSENELVITRRIVSLRIHVERAMERIKNFHIFDKTIPVSLTDIADRIFFVCCILTNFQQPLVK